MVRDCCEMYLFVKCRFAVLVVLLILPLLGSSTNLRKRRRPNLEHQQKTNDVPFSDQIAQASQFQTNRLANAQRGNSGSIVARDENYYKIKSALTEAETAEEYVHKALELQGQSPQPPIPLQQNTIEIKPLSTKYEVNPHPSPHPSPHPKYEISSNPKYEVYENEPAQTETAYIGYEREPVTRSNYVNYDFPNEPISKPLENLYKGHATEIYEQLNRPPHRTNERYQNAKYRYSEENLPVGSDEGPRDQILKHIEDSVAKYFKTLEVEGKRPVQDNKSFHNYEERPKVRKAIKNVPPGKTPVPGMFDGLNDNIQFIFKAKTRPPIQLQPRHPSSDHLANLKLPELDLSHFLKEDRPHKSKLFFHSDNYRDINDLPYRSPASSPQNSHQHAFTDHHSKKNINDDGYPIMNPYQYVLQKQPSETGWHPISPPNQLKSTSSGNTYDSYNPKYNNNPEGYGYQHDYKPAELNFNTSKRLTKQSQRGKRGGEKQNRSNYRKRDKDTEAHKNLRPPPYQTIE